MTRLSRWVRQPALVAGTVIVLGLVLIALFPGVFAPRDPEAKGRFLLEIGGQVYAAPFPPNVLYPLGSDSEARDLLSRLMYGTRRTLGIAVSIAVVRVALGAGLGVLAGWVGGAAGGWALTLSAVSATFPSLLFAWVIILAIGPGAGFGVFIVALGLTGWAHWTQLLATAVRRIRALPYMVAAEAVGVPPRTQLLRHVLPNLLPLIIPTLAQEVAAGRAVSGVTMRDVHEMNAKHSRDHAGVSRKEALELLARNSGAAAAAIRALSDEALERAAPVSLYEDAPLTCQFVLEDHAVRHSYHHLAAIRQGLSGRQR